MNGQATVLSEVWDTVLVLVNPSTFMSNLSLIESVVDDPSPGNLNLHASCQFTHVGSF